MYGWSLWRWPSFDLALDWFGVFAALNQCYFNAAPASATLARHKTTMFAGLAGIAPCRERIPWDSLKGSSISGGGGDGQGDSAQPCTGWYMGSTHELQEAVPAIVADPLWFGANDGTVTWHWTLWPPPGPIITGLPPQSTITIQEKINHSQLWLD